MFAKTKSVGDKTRVIENMCKVFGIHLVASKNNCRRQK